MWLMLGQGGTITYEDTVANLTMFSREVLPRLGELSYALGFEGVRSD